MRRRGRIAAIALAASAALLLAGCSGTATAEGTADAGAHVKTLYGTVTVPADPKRIVAIGFPEATALADLGITPVGRTTYIPQLPAYDKLFAQVPVVEDSDGKPDLEKIAALHPDLIIGSEFVNEKNASEYAKLTSIAPTVILEWKQAAGNWQNEAEGTAQAVGRTDRLTALRAAYAKHTEHIRNTYAKELASTTVDLISGDASNWFLYGANSSHGRVLVDAGARLGAAAKQKDGFVQYSPERYDLLGSTGLIVASGDDAAAIGPITSNAVFAATPAAEAGHVVTSSYFFSSSYRIADALLDDFESALKSLKATE